MNSRFRTATLALAAAIVLALGAACTSSGISETDYEAVKSQLADAQQRVSTAEGNLTASQAQATAVAATLKSTEDRAAAAESRIAAAAEEVASLQNQLKSAAPGFIIQAPTNPSPTSPGPTGWDTTASVKASVVLLSNYDSSGPAAWDPVAHPMVFVTSEGKGYAGFLSEKYKVAGFQIIDAKTKEVVASAGFDLGYKSMGTPHGLGVSPDGKWIYVPTADGDQPWAINGPGAGRILVVDARTLKLAQVIQTKFGPHHIKGFTDFKGRDRMIVETQGGHTLLLDPKDSNRVVLAMGPEDYFAQAYQADADPAGRYLYIGLVLGGRAVAPTLQGAVAKVDLDTNRITFITGVGMYPNGFAFTADGKTTYVADSSGDRIFKIDNATNKVVASTQAAVPGPYNIKLNADETELWVVGKGEMTYNLGGSLGLINTKTFTAVRDFHIGGQTIDHNQVNPADPTEMWVTSSGTADTIVFDMTRRTVKARVPTANGGDTHSGAFVKYSPDFTGELVFDNTGPRGSFLAEVKKRVEALAAAAPR
jgi:sugar lactone lactonase YvrE